MRIRLKKLVRVRRSLAMGSALHTYPAGDYEVGVDIPSDVAEDLLNAKRATRIKAKGERETKLADVGGQDRRVRSDGAEPDARAG